MGECVPIKVFSFQTERQPVMCVQPVRSEHGAGSPFQDASYLLEPWFPLYFRKTEGGVCARVQRALYRPTTCTSRWSPRARDG